MREAVFSRSRGILSYGITPPKANYPAEKRADVAARQSERINALPIDALVVYDLQDESARTAQTRPFPFISCVDSAEYALSDLSAVRVPKVVYSCVAQKPLTKLQQTWAAVEQAQGLSVLVGAASREQPTLTRLSDAQRAARSQVPNLPLGAVAIAERHEQRGNEDERVFAKLDAGCSFFITQAVYAVTPSKNLLSDLAYRGEATQRAVPTILVTLSPCGSQKTLEFLQWLGVSVPRWLNNDLKHAKDILQTSLDVCAESFADLWQFAEKHGIPLGCNVESVSLSKSEIDASVELVHRVAKIMGRG